MQRLLAAAAGAWLGAVTRLTGKRPAEEDADGEGRRQGKKGAGPREAEQMRALHRQRGGVGCTDSHCVCGPIGLTLTIFVRLPRRFLCVLCSNFRSAKGGPASTVETIQLPDDGRYVGELNGEGQPHGSGTKLRADGSEEASGQWRDGELHGRGKMVLLNGDRYEGEFVGDKFSGLGAFTWANGGVFEGEFNEDASDGFGIEWTAEGDVIECGLWTDDKLVEERPVPRSKVPVGAFLSASGQQRELAALPGARGRALTLPSRIAAAESCPLSSPPSLSAVADSSVSALLCYCSQRCASGDHAAHARWWPLRRRVQRGIQTAR
jgi:hypothetical protein